MTQRNEIPAWVLQEVGRLQLELVAAHRRIAELETEAESPNGDT